MTKTLRIDLAPADWAFIEQCRLEFEEKYGKKTTVDTACSGLIIAWCRLVQNDKPVQPQQKELY